MQYVFGSVSRSRIYNAENEKIEKGENRQKRKHKKRIQKDKHPVRSKIKRAGGQKENKHI